MAVCHDFTELRVYQSAESLDEKIWSLREQIFAQDKATWWQINRSVGSIADNIAEGFGRGSKGECKTFLGYASGSASEVRSQLRRLRRRSIIDAQLATKLIDQTQRLERSLKAFIASVRDSPNKGFRHTSQMMREEPANYGDKDHDALPF